MGRHRTHTPGNFGLTCSSSRERDVTPEELAREFEPTEQTINNWVAPVDRDAGVRHDGLTTAERRELIQLRRENRHLKMERDILSQAAT